MNRNTEAHFAQLPQVDIQRSIFDMSTDLKTSFNAGSLIPILTLDTLPGDTFTLDTSLVIRTTSPLVKPVMDNMFADIFYFAIPFRLVWKHFKEFMGENKSSAWTQTTEYTIPQLTAPSGGWNKGTIADYLTYPTKVSGISVSSLYTRAYALIWNEYFRDQNLQNPTDVPDTDATETGVNSGTLETDACKGGLPLPVNKIHDYFTSCLPEPQKGDDVLLPLGSSANVISNGENIKLSLYNNDTLLAENKIMTNYKVVQNGGSEVYRLALGGGSECAQQGTIKFGNQTGLKADLSNATASTINELRQAFATQRLLERDARGGTRYTEIIKSHFNVTSPDARLQRPEYLGGKRIPLNINQVIQTSGTENASGTQTTPQGNITSYMHTADKDSSFTKSFTEHSIIMGLICVRTDHTYQQGIERMFSRKRRLEYYWPAFANLGEQAVKNKEIFAQGTSVVDTSGNVIDEQGFGFQEAWADYRYKPSHVTGQMRSNATGTLHTMHFADNYASLPTLGSTWIQETKDNLDRCLAVTSSTSDQFMLDVYFKIRAARPMPTYSIPGMLDHN